MAILKLVAADDPVLYRPAEPVHKVSAKIQKLGTDLLDTMMVHDAIGFAAPQVGVSKRVIVTCCPETPGGPTIPRVLVNPVMVVAEGAMDSEEANPVFPGVSLTVRRFSRVVVRYTDLRGKPQTLAPPEGDLLACVLQHEIDHINGVVFTQRAAEPAADGVAPAAC